MSTTETTQEAAWMRQQALKALAGAKAAMEMAGTPLPPIVCLCGSTRFYEAFAAANLQLTLAGEIVLSIGCDTKSDGDLAAAGEIDLDAMKARLDELHKRKIDLADRVFVVSKGGYFGESTRSEIAYAIAHGKPVEFMESEAEERWNALAER
jgi:hypothetical protein